MIKIFGHALSTCTRKVLMTLAETNTPYELVVVNFTTGEHKEAAHVARQPFGQMPALEDEGFLIYESRAMIRYINDKVGGTLIPRDLRARGLMEQWISIETSNFTPHAMTFVYQHVFNRPQEAATIEAATRRLHVALGVMDARLQSSKFLAGDQLSLADICFMPYLEYVMGTPAKEIFSGSPRVLAWWSQLSERPAWRKVAGRA